MRLLVLLVAAVATLVEAVAVGAVLVVLGEIIRDFSMSMGHLPASDGRIALWVLGVVLGLGLALLAMALVVAAVRGKPFGRPTRVALVAALVVQGFLGLVLLLTARAPVVIGALFVFAALLLALVTEPAPQRVPARQPAL